MLKDTPFTSAAVFLLLQLAVAQLTQGAGHLLDISLVKASLPVGAIVAYGLTYTRFFARTFTNQRILVTVYAALWALALISAQIYDMTADGLGYQQPGAEAILAGWNPLHKTDSLWENLYPTGVWEMEAALAYMYGSIESAKMLQIWWLFIAYNLLLAGIRQHKGSLTRTDYALVALTVLCPVTLTQMLTHYVDAMIYCAGIAFLGAMLLYTAQARLSLLLMSCCILFIVNAKLSGIYHAVVLCAVAVLYIWLTTKRLPVKESAALFAAGMLATLALGYHPYVTNFLTYGSLLHMDGSQFAGHQRPANLKDMLPPQRFAYSIFSATGGAPRADAALKYPWQILPSEWEAAGTPDPRSGGYGVLFALCFCATIALLLISARSIADKRLPATALLLLASSLLFPESWWARYVPFGYAAFLLLLLALPKPKNPALLYGVIALFCANSIIAGLASFSATDKAQEKFTAIAAQLKPKPQGSVYLVPPGDDYMIYNHAHMPLQRRLKQLGVETTVKVNAPCPNKAAEISEFKICY